MRALKDNYKRNVDILRENLRRGLTPSQAVKIVKSWREQFEKHGLYGEDEKAFINQALEEIENYTHLKVVEI